MNEVTTLRTPTRTHHLRRVLLLLGNYYQQNHLGIARYAREAHWSLDTSYMRTGCVDPAVGRFDGVIGLITRPRELEALRQLWRPRKVPLVDLSAAWGTEVLPDPGWRRVPRVLYDNAGIARLAAQHFIGRGFKPIALFNQGNHYPERDRKVFFQPAVLESGPRFTWIGISRFAGGAGDGPAPHLPHTGEG